MALVITVYRLNIKVRNIGSLDTRSSDLGARSSVLGKENKIKLETGNRRLETGKTNKGTLSGGDIYFRTAVSGFLRPISILFSLILS